MVLMESAPLPARNLTRKRSPAQSGDRIRGTPQSGPCRRLGTNEARCLTGPARPLRRGHGPFQLPQRGRELSAGAHAELCEHLAQVVLDGSRTDEELACDLRVRVSIGSQPYDLALLGGENVAGLNRSLAHHLSGRQQLAAGALGERFGPDTTERLVGDAQVLAPVVAPVHPAQPLAVDQVSAGEMDDDSAALEALDCFTVERLRGGIVAQQRLRPGQDAESPVRAAGPGSSLEFLESGRGLLDSAASHASFRRVRPVTN